MLYIKEFLNWKYNLIGLSKLSRGFQNDVRTVLCLSAKIAMKMEND